MAAKRRPARKRMTLQSRLEAAVLAGEDGLGKGGLVGGFKRLAQCNPQAWVRLFLKVAHVPFQLSDHECPRSPTPSSLSPNEVAQLYSKISRNSPSPEATLVVQALVDGAALLGSDGVGKDGFVGYLTWLVGNHPLAILRLLSRVLQDELSEQIEQL